METIVQITGVQYACSGGDVSAVMAEMEREKPEVLLVKEQTHDFGIIVRALVGTQYRGVVSRFDLEQVLGMMQHGGVPVLVGRVKDVYREGLCYNICLSGDYAVPDCPVPSVPDLWTEWRWAGAPLLDGSPDDCRLDISLKVALSELQRGSDMNKQTLLEHLSLVLQLARWDVSHETQQQLSLLRRLVRQHDDADVRAVSPLLRHCLTSLGSTGRTAQFRDVYLPQLCYSKEAERMYRQWCAIHKEELSDVRQLRPAIVRQVRTIDESLKQLPADLYYEKDQFGTFMHRLLYLRVPRSKLVMLLSALVLRHLLKRQLGQTEDAADDVVEDVDYYTLQNLTPIFLGNADNAREFLLLARGQKPTNITRMVCLWVREKRISAAMCHRPLWTILHEAGIYGPTESNWNMQVTSKGGRGA